MEKIEQPEVLEENNMTEETEGSSLGKFKSATSLLEAYNYLQAEFTRKSQELASLKKSCETDEVSKNNALPEDNLGSSENASCSQPACENGDFMQNFDKKLSDFAEKCPQAKMVESKIKEQFLTFPELQKIEDGMAVAYALTCGNPAEMINNPEFVQTYILSNEKIKNMVVDDYIKSLAKPCAPKLISSESAGIVVAPKYQPKTLGDANKIFQKMLEN